MYTNFYADRCYERSWTANHLRLPELRTGADFEENGFPFEQEGRGRTQSKFPDTEKGSDARSGQVTVGIPTLSGKKRDILNIYGDLARQGDEHEQNSLPVTKRGPPQPPVLTALKPRIRGSAVNSYCSYVILLFIAGK